MKLNLRNAVAVLGVAGTIGGLGVGAATAAETGQAQSPSTVAIRESPTPDCADNGGATPCYEYQAWFWTFDSCNAYVRDHPFDSSKYDRSVCAVFSGGLNVGLWYHRIR